MGTGIAIVANRKCGLPVKIVDSSEISLINSKKFIESHFEKEIVKKTMSRNEKEVCMNRFTFSRNIQDLSESQFVIEVKINKENFSQISFILLILFKFH